MYDVVSTAGANEIVEKMRDFYDREADRYIARTGDFEFFPGLREELDRFLSRVPDGRIMDLGCGAGRDARHMARKGRRVVAADISRAMLLTTGASRRVGTGQVDLVQADARFLPMTNGGVVGVWACGSLLHLPRTAIGCAIGEMARVLAVGGVAAISMKAGRAEGWREGASLEGARWFTYVDPDEFCADLQRQDFSDVTWTSSGRRDWFVAEATKGAG